MRQCKKTYNSSLGNSMSESKLSSSDVEIAKSRILRESRRVD